MPLFRSRTFDAAIWSSVHCDYPALPRTFDAGEVVVDVGCHTGAFAVLAADRGARILGFEPSRENFALAVINLRHLPSVSLRQRAVWRSDVRLNSPLFFTPSADAGNTGGGSVLFSSEDEHWAAVPGEVEAPLAPRSIAAHPVDSVALDDVIVKTGPVRVLKLDVEGAEFPILLTSRRLDLVQIVLGEYHEFDGEAMTALRPEAVVGEENYTVELLCHRLESVGFQVEITPTGRGRGLFVARR